MRFDCSHWWKHRVVVASQCRSPQLDLSSGLLRIYCLFATRGCAVGAAIALPQHIGCVSVATIARVAAGPGVTIGRRSVIRW